LLEFSAKAHMAIIVILFAFTYLTTMLTSKLIREIIENHSEFWCARIAAINLLQIDLDKS